LSTLACQGPDCGATLPWPWSVRVLVQASTARLPPCSGHDVVFGGAGPC
jgi:hypothetical protein